MAQIEKFIVDAASVLVGFDKADVSDALTKSRSNLNAFCRDPTARTFYCKLVFFQAVVRVCPKRCAVCRSGENGEVFVSESYSKAMQSGQVISFLKRVSVSELNQQDAVSRKLQVNVLSYGDSERSSLEALQNMLQNSVDPLLSAGDAVSTADEMEDDAASRPVVTTRKKLQDFVVAVQLLQSSSRIPSVTLEVDSRIQSAVTRAKKEGREAKVEDLGAIATENKFLNELQNLVAVWSKDIGKVAKQWDEQSEDKGVDEVMYWSHLESGLRHIIEELERPEVKLQLAVLNNAKRAMYFESQTGVKQRLEEVVNVNLLMSDFPINEILGAPSLDRLKSALVLVFAALRKAKSATSYPVLRLMSFMQAIKKDLAAQMHKLLVSSIKPMEAKFHDFDVVYRTCREIFQTWDDELIRVKDMARSIARAKNMTVTLPATKYLSQFKLKNRLEDIYYIRIEHYKLTQTVNQVVATEGKNPSNSLFRELANTMACFADISPLDLTATGDEEWSAAQKTYQGRVDKFEQTIIARLKSKLSQAHSGSQMFRIFSDFNRLINDRPKIRVAVQEYQGQLVDQVVEDFKELQRKHREGYLGTGTEVVFQQIDLPPAALNYLWLRQFENRIQNSLKRMTDVLGKQFDETVQGQKLKSEADTLLKQLDSESYYKSWLENVKQNIRYDETSNVMQVVKTGADRYSLSLCIKPMSLLTWKEARILSSITPHRQGVRVKSLADDFRRIWPLCVSLEETFRTLTSVADKLENDPHLRATAPLVAAENEKVLTIVEMGLSLRWSSEKLEVFCRDVAQAVASLDRTIDEVASIALQVNILLKDLADLKPEESQAALDKISVVIVGVQDYVEKLLEKGSFSNVRQYVDIINGEIAGILTSHLMNVVRQWRVEFEGYPRKGTKLITHPTTHKMTVVDKKITVVPPMSAALQSWYRAFHRTLKKVVCVKKVSLQRNSEKTFVELTRTVDPKELQAVYTAIDNLVRQADAEARVWSGYNALWDLDLSELLASAGEDARAWNAIIDDIKKSRQQFSRVSDRKALGPIILELSEIQPRLEKQYDKRLKEVMEAYSESLEENVANTFEIVTRMRASAEKQGNLGSAKFATIDPNTLPTFDETCRAIVAELVTFVERLKSAAEFKDTIGPKVESLQVGERMLVNAGFQLPSQWIPVERVQGEADSFVQLVAQQNRAYERYKPTMKTIVLAMEKKLKQAITQVNDEWKNNKPTDSGQAPQNAMNIINSVDLRLTELSSNWNDLESAKGVLGLPTGGRLEVDGIDPRLLQEEITNMKSVWSELGSLYDALTTIRSTDFAAFNPRKVREQLEQLKTSIKQIPARVRQYEAFEGLERDLEEYILVHPLMVDLKSEILKERHWKKILDLLNIKKPYSELTLGDLYKAQVKTIETSLKEVVNRAQGEAGLSEFLSNVKETWTAMEFQLTQFKNKTQLIAGFDDVFAVLDEHLSLLQTMKLSPYFSSFEEDANTWEEKLSRLRALLEVWLEVQRKWVYLEGVFTGSADIQSLLPSEYSRFKSIDTEFLSLAKKVAARPKVIETLNVEGLLKTLTRLSDSLSKVQRALSDYLEKQRVSFPRFYFVGDEDMLEMIGNAKDPLVIERHVNKMFAGIAALVIHHDEGLFVRGMRSSEGEVVDFPNPIEITPTTSLMTWLTALEKNMKFSLQESLAKSLKQLPADVPTDDSFFDWLNKFPTQIVILSLQIRWTEWIEKSLQSAKPLEDLRKLSTKLPKFLSLLAERVLKTSDRLLRTRACQLVTEVVHQRDVVNTLIAKEIASPSEFTWLEYMRFYYTSSGLRISMANADFTYGFEYLGAAERLVQTPLTDKCYLTMTQALHLRLGGNPFGPAGTGKTETVKFLGAALGRFVLVFNCDESFDFTAMGRIFVGLCEVGAWGCFDEFNRLEERMLSAVSEQILTIQLGLRGDAEEISLVDKKVRLSPNVGIFVTMNPGYAGRSNLPDNLKQLCREFAMVAPDRNLITEVLLYSQGFRTANLLAPKIVALFDLCLQQLSQPHYDFGLRSLKSVLSSAGQLKRKLAEEGEDEDENVEEQELNILLRSISDSLVPKLVHTDVATLRSLLTSVFPGADFVAVDEELLEDEIRRLCHSKCYECDESWLQKVLQIYQIQKLNHGLMIVGPTGVGKSAAWKILLETMRVLDGVSGVHHVIDPKAITKEQLYGKLDSTTLEWTDGVFTSLMRSIVNGQSAKSRMRHWICFDGDVDPEWAENLNSVLDDNKLLTLPNGERFQLPSNVRILFEVESLKSATLATVSRCGMVWMSEDVLPIESICQYHLRILGAEDKTRMQAAEKELNLKPAAQAALTRLNTIGSEHPQSLSKSLSMAVEDHRVSAAQNVLKPSAMSAEEATLRAQVVTAISPFFDPEDVVLRCLDIAKEFPHIMTYTPIRLLESLIALMTDLVEQLHDQQDEFNAGREAGEYPTEDAMHTVILKRLLLGIIWAFGGSMPLAHRQAYAKRVASEWLEETAAVSMPADLGVDDSSLLDFGVEMKTGDWVRWRDKAQSRGIGADQVDAATLVIETADTTSHRNVIGSFLRQRRPFILCGPPGSGKTMTLSSTLKAHESDFEVASLNFSSGTTPEMLMQTFNMYCEYVKTSNGTILRPTSPGKWLILFCDEVNLPTPDAYGTQRVITFMRQIVTTGTFWKMTSPGQWELVTLHRIQLAGACNPPTDAGRHPMSNRFLRTAPLLFVDFPGPDSLRTIYGTFNKAMLRDSLAPLANNLTQAMVAFYMASQQRFTVDEQPHYIYSPRELTRWKVAINEALRSKPLYGARDLVRLAIYEAERIFQDRLVEAEHREWTEEKLNDIFMAAFPEISPDDLTRPILFSPIATGVYEECVLQDLHTFVESKLKIFNEEAVSVKLVLFEQCLHHIIRIDRVLRQPLGHLLLVGVSGAGKTILSKFVSWLNGLTVFQIKAGRNYDTVAFENDLRYVMKATGIREEKMTFIFDESNVLGPAFLERMNALLASGEVPGLFEGDEYSQLISECKSAFGADIDDGDIFAKFTQRVQRNLHIVFTMNPANPDFYNRQATSPALFNRCVIDWFGEWTEHTLETVARELTEEFEVGAEAFSHSSLAEDERRDLLAQAIVSCHESVREMNEWLGRQGKKRNHLAPRDFLDFIRHLVKLMHEKRQELTERTKHLSSGLQKLADTEKQVAELQASLAVKEKELAEKQKISSEKMQMMLTQKADLEQKKKVAQELAEKLDAAEAPIAESKRKVEAELAQVEPLLLEAKKNVEGIPKASISEISSMTSPPAMVKTCLEAVVLLLTNAGDKPIAWDDCRRVMRVDFINKILSFDATKQLSEATVHRIKTKYLGAPEWDYDRIDKASKAAGPLAKWVSSSLAFGEIILKVDPLRREIAELEKALTENKRQLEETRRSCTEYEQTLVKLQAEYAQCIADEQQIKREMEEVNRKVHNSKVLLTNLSAEQKRWSESETESRDALRTDVGDNLLAAAFCTYVGFFEQGQRERIMGQWRIVLQSHSLQFQPALSMTEYLSRASDRYSWLMKGLPNDDLSMENTVILDRFIRYPLIVDPSGAATEFVCNLYADRKVTVTSFTDNNFIKQLESALRFGTALLVQDVEDMGAILNNVLNQETKKVAGHELVTVGDNDIDLSPTFIMFLVTRDPTVQLTPDIASRVTIINYTITPASLRNQCLNMVLRSERPEVEKQRQDVLKLQGEFKAKIRDLEDQLLQALNATSGNILDDNKVINTLETLKAEAEQVKKEAERADQVYEEVEKSIEVYLALADGAARLYTTLEHLNTYGYLYYYDLSFFQKVFNRTLADKSSLEALPATAHRERAEILTTNFFKNLFHLTAPSQLSQDTLVLALQFARIRMEILTNLSLQCPEMIALLQGGYALNKDAAPTRNWSKALPGLLSDRQRTALELTTNVPSLRNLHPSLETDVDFWKKFLRSSSPETEPLPQDLLFFGHMEPNLRSMPKEESEKISHLIELLAKACIIRALRADRLQHILEAVVTYVFDQDFLKVPVPTTDRMKGLVESIVDGGTPVMMISAPGFDPSSRVVSAAQACKRALASVALGSSKGGDDAMKVIGAASQQGSWVLLKNVHLAGLKWLTTLEKTITKQKHHASFRLFLTMEFQSGKVPANLLRKSYKFVFEPPVGIKASLERTYSSLITTARVAKEPSMARGRLYFIAAYLHALVLERRRFAPIGWTKAYEFSDADLNCTLQIIDEWVDRAASSDPEKLPWLALRTLVKDAIYGGRIDNPVDHQVLDGFVDDLFSARYFEENVDMTNVGGIKTPPLGKSLDVYIKWVDMLPPKDNPSWIGLSSKSDALLAAETANEQVTRWALLHSRSAEDLADFIPKRDLMPILEKQRSSAVVESLLTRNESKRRFQRLTSKLGGGSAQELLDKAESLLNRMPQILSEPQAATNADPTPLARFFFREIENMRSTLAIIGEHLTGLRSVALGEVKSTNLLRELASKVVAQEVPAPWVKLPGVPPHLLRLAEWMFNLVRRCVQLNRIACNEYGCQLEASPALDDSKRAEFETEVTQEMVASIPDLKAISSTRVWLGGMSHPKGYLSATEQTVAQKMSWSLDDLRPVLKIDSTDADDQSFIIFDLYATGCQWNGKKLSLSEEEVCRLPPSSIKWVKQKEIQESNYMSIPVYMSKKRQVLVCQLYVEMDGKEDTKEWRSRGISITLAYAFS